MLRNPSVRQGSGLNTLLVLLVPVLRTEDRSIPKTSQTQSRCRLEGDREALPKGKNPIAFCILFAEMLEKASVRQGSGQKEKPPKGLKWNELFGEVPQIVRLCEGVIAFSPCRSCGACSLPAGVGD